MKYFLRYLTVALGLCLGAALVPDAHAANRFWNPYSVTGAVSDGGVCELTISPAIIGSGIVTGTTVNVTSVTGATGCNVSTTATVIDSTHIDLDGTTFGGAYISGGCVAGGQWTSTNTANWASSSTATCGSGGSSVPGSSDTANLDANSLAGTIVPNVDFNVAGIVQGAFPGTLDFSVNNNSPTIGLGAWLLNGSGTQTLKLGSGTFTITTGNAGTALNSTNTNLTLVKGTATIDFKPNSSVTWTVGASQSWPTISMTGTAVGSSLFISASTSIDTITLPAGVTLSLAPGATFTLANAPTWTGTSSNSILITGGNEAARATLNVSSGTPSLTWCMITTLIWGGTTGTATNSLTTGGVTNLTITPPSGGASGHIIGG